jgi:hypothetical protein
LGDHGEADDLGRHRLCCPHGSLLAGAEGDDGVGDVGEHAAGIVRDGDRRPPEAFARSSTVAISGVRPDCETAMTT